MNSLDEIYAKGNFIIPNPGRYYVEMCIAGEWKTVLEKKIGRFKGTNHLPMFFLRKFNIPHMSFVIGTLRKEVLFIYDNNLLVDRLRKVDYRRWLGKVYYNGNFLDYFFLVRI